jgi:hypothetical protein
MTKRYVLFIMFIAILLLSGCTISFGGGQTVNDGGGIYKSVNKGEIWGQKPVLTAQGRIGTIGGLNVAHIALDPSDSKALYMGSVDNGLFFTYDGAESWQAVNTLPKATIKAIAVDPQSKCVIYAVQGNKTFRSTDCSRTWTQIYYDTTLTVEVNAVAVDFYNSANIYIGTSKGEIIKSTDRGGTWRTLNRFNNSLQKILLNPTDSRIIMAATLDKGIFRSMDSGETWQDLKPKLKEFPDYNKFRDLSASVIEPNTYILATKTGLLRTINNGDDWTKINLITSNDRTQINSLAMNPKNAKEIYYVTNTTFYRSLDGGTNWATKKLPTGRAGWKLIVSPDDGNIIYLGVKAIQ